MREIIFGKRKRKSERGTAIGRGREKKEEEVTWEREREGVREKR